MCSLCRLPVGKKHNFGQYLIFGDSCTDPLLPMTAKFGVQKQTQGLHLHAKFHLNVFIVWPKTTIGAMYRPLLPMRPNLVCYSRPMVYTFTCEISSGSVYSVVLWRRKTPNFGHILPYFGLRHLVLSPIGNSLTMLNTGAQLQTFRYPKASKSFLYSNAFMAKSAQNSHVQKRDGQTNRQTNRQTKNSNVFGHPRGG